MVAVVANLTKAAPCHWGGVVVSDTVFELKQGVALTNDLAESLA